MTDVRGWTLADYREPRSFFERAILRLVPKELLGARPGGVGNSIAWLLWHLARVGRAGARYSQPAFRKRTNRYASMASITRTVTG
jgi:hypothetical protein